MEENTISARTIKYLQKQRNMSQEISCNRAELRDYLVFAKLVRSKAAPRPVPQPTLAPAGYLQRYEECSGRLVHNINLQHNRAIFNAALHLRSPLSLHRLANEKGLFTSPQLVQDGGKGAPPLRLSFHVWHSVDASVTGRGCMRKALSNEDDTAEGRE